MEELIKYKAKAHAREVAEKYTSKIPDMDITANKKQLNKIVENAVLNGIIWLGNELKSKNKL